MFQDLKNGIYYPVLTIFGGGKHNDGFNPDLLKCRDFVVSMRKLFGNFKDNSARVNINLNKQNLHSVLA